MDILQTGNQDPRDNDEARQVELFSSTLFHGTCGLAHGAQILTPQDTHVSHDTVSL